MGQKINDANQTAKSRTDSEGEIDKTRQTKRETKTRYRQKHRDKKIKQKQVDKNTEQKQVDPQIVIDRIG